VRYIAAPVARKLSDMHLADLHRRAAEAGVEGYRKLRRPELVAALEPGETEVTGTLLEDEGEGPVGLGAEGAEGGDEREDEREDVATHEVSGTLEVTRQGYGFLRLDGLAASDDDVYISAAQVRRCELRAGDEVTGPARDPRRGERHRALVHVDRVNGAEPGTEERPRFDSLDPIQPERRIELSEDAGPLVRAVDLLNPLAYGQRILIRSAPRSGRTTLLRSIALEASRNDSTRVIVLLIDERPEEATAWRRELPTAEFAIATSDQAGAEQVRTAELALERARRVAETGGDAVLICDSLSRLAYAAGDGDEVKRLFGSGRNLAGGGSLTVAATVLADARDEGEAERAVLTTESSLVVLDADLAAAGVTPALAAAECQISNEDQIRDAAELDAVRRLRSLLGDLKPADAAALLREKIATTRSNTELLSSL
jgi:transcription termination factor Rho